jgi:hypothetical protein
MNISIFQRLGRNRFQAKNQSFELQSATYDLYRPHIRELLRKEGGIERTRKKEGKIGKAINGYANWKKSSDYTECITR